MEPETQRSAPSLDVSTPAGGMSGTQIPDLMKIGSAPTNTQLDVESDILEPVVFNESFARYRLQNKGILHSNSKLTFSVKPNATLPARETFFPLNIGIHSLIERCVLKSGTKTICETSDFGEFMSFRSSFINPQHNKQREALTTGRMMCRKWEYDDGANATSVLGAGAGVSDTDAIGYTLDSGVEIDGYDKAPADRDINLPYYNLMNGSGSTNGTKTSPVYQISLNDLFPFLKMNQLPLYMMKEELDIELFFVKELKRGCISNFGGQANFVPEFKLDRDNCKMVADYLYYPQEIMTAYANSNNKMSFTYVDYRLVKHTVKSDGAAANTLILNCGGAGRIVNKLHFGLFPEGIVEPERQLLNDYAAQGIDTTQTGTATDNMGIMSHNVRYNDNFLYPVDINNEARVFSNIHMAEGAVPFISKDEFSGEQGLAVGSKVLGQVWNGNIRLKSFHTEDRLNRNERINSRGIELYQTWNTVEAGNYTLRVWLELVRMATLEDGILTPVFA